MPEHQEVYSSEADQYDRLVSCEDYEGHILSELLRLFPLQDAAVVELGAGTGRLTRLVAPLARSVAAFDQSASMLAVAGDRLRQDGRSNCQCQVADHRHIPLPDGRADLVLSGWSICYLAVWNPESWQNELESALQEMLRLLRPGGSIILLETLGTGHKTPAPPPHLLNYYGFLEEHAFTRSWIRSDYRFASQQQAEELSRFFFGDAMIACIKNTPNGIILPECTGFWQLQKT